MSLLWKQIAVLFGKKEPSREDLMALRAPRPEVDLPKSLQAIIRFAETKQILDQLLYAKMERKARSIAVLSEFTQEGRTLMTAIISVGFSSLMRKKILVVDCSSVTNKSSLTLERLLEVEDEGVAGMEEIRKTLTLNVSFLKLKDWAEHFGTIAEYDVKSILDGPGKGFDLVIFDTSPMAAKNRNNIDPIAVARRCDASLLLVSPRTSSRSQLVNLRERIRREKLDLLGLMVNEGVLA